MLYVVSARVVAPYRLQLTFNDGAAGLVDLTMVERIGVFKEWDDPQYFEQVRVDEESGTVVWPNGADLDPYVLYSEATGIPIAELMNLDA